MRFECQPDCGKCCVAQGDCGFVFLTEYDMLRIEKHLGTKRTDWAAYGKFDYTRRSNGKPDESWYLVNNKDRCRFLEGTKCGIYEHRPAACRNFPFFPEHMEPNKWESLSSFCPGINKGKEWSPEEVASIVDEQKRTDAV